MNQQQQTAIQCIKSVLSITEQDALSARAAFKGLDLEDNHGQSGETRARILAEYDRDAGMLRDALKWAESPRSNL